MVKDSLACTILEEITDLECCLVTTSEESGQSAQKEPEFGSLIGRSGSCVTCFPPPLGKVKGRVRE